jgi:hypothetical protein
MNIHQNNVHLKNVIEICKDLVATLINKCN